jgi:hypothetical protein
MKTEIVSKKSNYGGETGNYRKSHPWVELSAEAAPLAEAMWRAVLATRAAGKAKRGAGMCWLWRLCVRRLVCAGARSLLSQGHAEPTRISLHMLVMRSSVLQSNAHEMPVHGCMARISGCESIQSTSNSLEIAMHDQVNMQQVCSMHEKHIGMKRGEFKLNH